ncbi:MAG: hypothetical protein AB8B63_25370 [Granulosicoccus sp.]
MHSSLQEDISYGSITIRQVFSPIISDKGERGVASAATQMSASTNEIARSSAEATRIAGNAVLLAGTTEATLRQLSTSSNDIRELIKVKLHCGTNQSIGAQRNH